MLSDPIEIGRLRNLTLEGAAKLAFELLSAEQLKEAFEAKEISRRAFCEFLDIGENPRFQHGSRMGNCPEWQRCPTFFS